MIDNLTEFVTTNPEVAVVIGILAYVIVRFQRNLSYREYRFLQLGKSFLFPALDAYATKRGRPLVRYKNATDTSEEYITSSESGPRETYKRLRQSGCSPHLLATLKARQSDSGTQYAHSQLVRMVNDGMQVEYYLFPNADNGTDIYGHSETAVTDPEGHLEDPQTKAELPENF